jgi:ribosomal-protein-alanine N-acetyltransferase
MRLPPYLTFPELTTTGVLLRQVTEHDLGEVLDISFYDARPATSLAEAEAMLRQINTDYARGECVHWGIADPRTGLVMGTVGFYRGFAEGIGELGCVLKPAFRGQGIMRAAMEVVVKFGLEEIGLLNVVALTTVQNLPAIRLLERLHFRPAVEGGDSEIRYSLY